VPAGATPALEAWMASFGERVVGAMRLDANTFEEIERDPTAMGQAAGVIVLAAVSMGVGNLFWGGMSGIVFRIIIGLIAYVCWAVIVWIVGTKVMPDPNTKADFAETFRVIAFAASPGVLGIITIIPILGWLLSFILWLWQFVAMIVAVKAVLDYNDYLKPIVVVIIGWIVYAVVWALLATIFIGSALVMGSLR
jgi:hypothetical protein